MLVPTGRFFDTIIDVDNRYHAFTLKPDQHWYLLLLLHESGHNSGDGKKHFTVGPQKGNLRETVRRAIVMEKGSPPTIKAKNKDDNKQ